MSMGFFTFEIISVDITRLIFHFRNHVNENFHLRNYLGGISRDEIFALRNHFALSLDIQGPYCEISGSPKYPSSNATELNDFGFRLYNELKYYIIGTLGQHNYIGDSTTPLEAQH
jgi:hypothetical protein